MLGVHAIEAFSVSEHVVVRVYSIFVIALDIETVCESDPTAEVSVPEIVQDDAVVELAVLAAIEIAPLIVTEAVASLVGANIARIE